MQYLAGFLIGVVLGGLIVFARYQYLLSELRKGVAVANAFATEYSNEFKAWVAKHEAPAEKELSAAWEKAKAL